MDDLEIRPLKDGVLVLFPPGRPWAIYRAFRQHFPKAKPAANWSWHVPGATAGLRVERWQAAQLQAENDACRRAQQAAIDAAWEAAAP